jgi:hypothetical protein
VHNIENDSDKGVAHQEELSQEYFSRARMHDQQRLHASQMRGSLVGAMVYAYVIGNFKCRDTLADWERVWEKRAVHHEAAQQHWLEKAHVASPSMAGVIRKAGEHYAR